jgi:hypothetical protein
MSRYFIAFLAASFALLCFVAVLDRMAAGQLRQFATRRITWILDRQICRFAKTNKSPPAAISGFSPIPLAAVAADASAAPVRAAPHCQSV